MLKVEKLKDDDTNTEIKTFIGAEARGTFFYTPEGYSLPLDNPADLQVEAMLINIGKPGGGRCTFPSDECPVPKASLARDTDPYSGILECPCTDARKIEFQPYAAANGPTCGSP